MSFWKRLWGVQTTEIIGQNDEGEVVSKSRTSLAGITNAQAAATAVKTATKLREYESTAKRLGVNEVPIVKGYVKIENERIGRLVSDATAKTGEVTLLSDMPKRGGVKGVLDDQYEELKASIRNRNSERK